ncbi:GNAT family N-acetyltransferase [Marinactinospora thermotolerans]|uniref:Ribosomal protein S18 acetylase RimI n=1 Tax=Marinactinospora thermotolerans DSM 45154 TaxID=1122192 RepID=A0A1T4SPE9_9ACTN|nr:GNAT family N-acetyltransferase [Marinactinospora thermotolerans]SKA29761.1 Ribosomal protein S18 acetylase RimI [Marinactinospora thermotolerans DSM 45154]
MEIGPYEAALRDALLQLSIRAWRPVFTELAAAVPPFVFAAFYPRGWEARQIEDLGEILDDQPDSVYVAFVDGVPVGWVCVRIHPDDDMGEIYVLAVDPAYQRRGIATALMEHAFTVVREAGMSMIMVETGDDPGHAASRATYEAAGFRRWPVARYFKDLTAVSDGPDRD